MVGKILYANNASSTLAGNISAVAVTANLAPGGGALFPAPGAGEYFCMTFIDQATGLQNEIVHVTNVTGDVITMVRAQEGTAAQSWAAGDIAANLVTAGTMDFFFQGYFTDTLTGGTHTYDNDDDGVILLRDNSGSAAMIDTLPGTGVGVLGNGWWCTIANNDASKIMALVSGSGATLDGGTGAIYLGPGQRLTVMSDGSNYWTQNKPTRCRLGANTTMYVDVAGGSGTATGVAVTAATARTTAQAVSDIVQKQFDLNGFVMTIMRANALTYTDAVLVNGAYVGATLGAASVIFDASGMGNVTVTATNTYSAQNGAQFTVQNQKLAGNGNLRANYGGAILSFNNVNIAGSNVQIAAGTNGVIFCTGNYTISAGGIEHYFVDDGGYLTFTGAVTVTVSGTPAFSTAFCAASHTGNWRGTATFSGSATGVRFLGDYNAIINTGGGGINFFPGNSAGSTSTTAYYI